MRNTTKHKKTKKKKGRSHQKPANNGEIKYIIEHLQNPISILDERKGSFIFANHPFLEMTGLTLETAYKVSLEEYLQHIHAKDVMIVLNEIKDDVHAACSKYMHDMKQQVTFTINYRFRQKEGNYIHVMVQNTVLDWFHDLQQAVVLSLYTDISSHKKDYKIVLTINTLDNTEKQWNPVLVKEFIAKPEMLSARECELMKMMVKEKTANEIAKQLNLKYYTVRAHWRNILMKVGCKSQKELKEVAIREGWI